MDAYQMLQKLEKDLEKSVKVPFIEKILIDKEEILDKIKEIIVNFPDEFKQAKWLVDEREKFLTEAQKEAEKVINEAEGKIIALIDEFVPPSQKDRILQKLHAGKE